MRRAAVLVLVVIGAVLWPVRPLSGPSARISSLREVLPPLLGETLPIAQVVCEGSRTRALSLAVRLQGHGVDFLIQNVTHSTFGFYPWNAGDGPGTRSELASHGDSSVPPGIKLMRWLVPPGFIRVGCIPQGTRPRDRLLATDPVLRLVDPHRIYAPIPAELDCPGDGSRSYVMTGPLCSGDPEEPVRVVRQRLVGLRPSDVLERVGYPEEEYPWVTVVRRNRVVAMVDIGPVVSSDSSMVSSCNGSGIRPVPPSSD
jgi:hypothetical protein